MKYKVELEVESDVSPANWGYTNQFGLLYLIDREPTAIVTEINPAIPEGWYQRMEAGKGLHVEYFSAHELAGYVEDYGFDTFNTKYRRVHPPVPWVNNSKVEDDSKYTDGYYQMAFKYSTLGTTPYRRIDGKWEFMLAGEWYYSSYDDDTIETDSHWFVPED